MEMILQQCQSIMHHLTTNKLKYHHCIMMNLAISKKQSLSWLLVIRKDGFDFSLVCSIPKVPNWAWIHSVPYIGDI